MVWGCLSFLCHACEVWPAGGVLLLLVCVLFFVQRGEWKRGSPRRALSEDMRGAPSFSLSLRAPHVLFRDRVSTKNPPRLGDALSVFRGCGERR